MYNEYDLARAAIACIPYENREQWVRVGLALKNAFGDTGRPLFESFTEKATDKRIKELPSSWRSFKSGGDRGTVTLGSLINMAKQHGFVPGQSQISKTTREELAAAKKAQRQRARDEAIQRKLNAELAASKAIDRWKRANRSGESEYLSRKKLTPEAVRYEPSSGALLLPMIRYDLPQEQAFVGVQAMYPKGYKTEDGEDLDKTFTKDAAKVGAGVRLGLAEFDAGLPICIGEGYATVRTVRMAMRDAWTCFVAFDAGNLLPLARIVRAKYPHNWILFLADDDHLTYGNPGASKALSAARRIKNADSASPWFQERGDKKLTDWNDLHCTEGLHTVTAQITRIMENVRRYGARRFTA
jgi:putative DNA primase/helicase